MTTATIHSQPVSRRQARPKTGRTQIGVVDVIAASVLVLRPVVVSAAIVAAAVTWATPARADAVGDSITTVLNSVGIGNNGPISTVIAQIGQSICPLLVQPGTNFASNATQMSGNGGLAPPIAGFLAGQAIQAECPAFMTAIANGTMPFPLTGASTSPTPFGLPGGSPTPVPLQLPGMNAPTPSPLQLPGL